MPSSIPRSDSIPGLSTLDRVVSPPEVVSVSKEDCSDSGASTMDSEEHEEINVQSWSLVGRKISETLAAMESDDDFEVQPPIDVKNWSAVGARIAQTLMDLSDDEDSN
mmetsp:Transcript_9488/g.10988  ORF Transcript_9488/g.10988 Transcript_9488/m.10988 type:complete len:108 (+) Transcript_9488:98-421(+)